MRKGIIMNHGGIHTFTGRLRTAADEINDEIGISLETLLLPSCCREKLEISRDGRRVTRERCLIELLAEHVQ